MSHVYHTNVQLGMSLCMHSDLFFGISLSLGCLLLTLLLKHYTSLQITLGFELLPGCVYSILSGCGDAIWLSQSIQRCLGRMRSKILLIGSQVISKVCFLLRCEGAALMCQIQ